MCHAHQYVHVVERLISILQEGKEQPTQSSWPLAQSVPSIANSEVRSVIESQNNKKRGQYAKYTPEQKSMIGKRAAVHVVYAICTPRV